VGEALAAWSGREDPDVIAAAESVNLNEAPSRGSY
jgi:hypothetical protein